jgi:ribosomal protein S3
MGQKTNPNILRLGKTANWKYQYFEKKSIESSIYTFKNLEIENFIVQFFKMNGLTVQDTKLYYFDNTLHIFVSYFLTLKTISIVSLITKNQKIRFTDKPIKFKKKELKRRLKIKKMSNSYFKHEELKYLKNLQKKVTSQYLKKSKVVINNEKNKLKVKRIKFLKELKQYLNFKKVNSKHEISTKTNFFFKESLLESISKFIQKQINISITLKQLNNNIKQEISKKEQKLVKKNLIKLRKYKQNKFFKEGINILFTSIKTNNSAKLLSKFIAIELKNLKRHNFFLKFVKTTLTLFYNKNFSNCKRIKIQVKGRFNGAPRARNKLINIGNRVPVLTINSKIDYAESTAFTSNGTFGVKVWINEKIN